MPGSLLADVVPATVWEFDGVMVTDAAAAESVFAAASDTGTANCPPTLILLNSLSSDTLLSAMTIFL